MSLDEFIHTKRDQLIQFEHAIEQRARGAGEVVRTRLEAIRSKRDDLVASLDRLKGQTHDRLDVIRMGFDSAWVELQTAFETATSRDPNKKADKSSHNDVNE